MARIAVVGSVAMDRVVALRSPLREGAHLEGEDKGERLGGGGANAALALARAGQRAALVGAVGDDDAGRKLLAGLEMAGVDVSAMRIAPGPSTRSLIFVDPEGERTIVNLSRARESESPKRLLEMKSDVIYVRDRDPALAPLLARCLDRASVIGHMPPTAEASRPAHVLVASRSDVGPEILDDPLAAGRGVAGPRLNAVVITAGAEGAFLYEKGRDVVRIPARSVRPVDTTGAGDAFAAGLAFGLASGMGVARATEIGVSWGTEATLWPSSSPPAEAMAALVR